MSLAYSNFQDFQSVSVSVVCRAVGRYLILVGQSNFLDFLLRKSVEFNTSRRRGDAEPRRGETGGVRERGRCPLSLVGVRGASPGKFWFWGIKWCILLHSEQ